MTELIVALDFPQTSKAIQCVEALEGLPVLFKVGFELFISSGPELVRELARRKKRIFLDLKFSDIPNTVSRAALQVSELQIEMFTVHLTGGGPMIKAVKKAFLDHPDFQSGSRKPPKILGVSVLTSFDEESWGEVTEAMTGYKALPSQSVEGLVRSGLELWGADGIVCSPHELHSLREKHPGLYTVVPGVRPAGYKPAGEQADDQARIMLPQQARLAGASAVVIGRPITQSETPRKVAELILRDLA